MSMARRLFGLGLVLLAVLAPRALAAADSDLVEFTFKFADVEERGVVLIRIGDQSPLGAARFRELVAAEFYDGACFFRVIKGFMAQVGIPPVPARSGPWKRVIPDDPAGTASNERGAVTFAMAGKNTRTFQIFFSVSNNSFLDKQGFTPFAFVEKGLDVIDRLHVTGEGAPKGPGPDQGKLQQQGNAYLARDFPKLTCIETARFVTSDGGKTGSLLRAGENPVIDKGASLLVAGGVGSQSDAGLLGGAGVAISTDLLGDDTDSASGSVLIVCVFVAVVFTVVCFRFSGNKIGNRDLEA